MTPNRPDERWPAGEFVNQSATDTGLAEWTKANRKIENTDVVLWYVFGIHHITRPEDWPVMPVDVVSFWLKPYGFFDRNPALDVVGTPPDTCHTDERQVPVTGIERPQDLTAEWLTAAVGAGTVERFTTERIGTGQMSECYRVELGVRRRHRPDRRRSCSRWPPPIRRVGRRVLRWDCTNARCGSTPTSHHASAGPSRPATARRSTPRPASSTSLLGDAAPAVVGDEIRGATIEQARLAVAELGRLHAPLLGDAALADVEWLNRESPMNQALVAQLYAGFVDRYGDQHRTRASRRVRAVGRELRRIPASRRSRRHVVHGLVHGDYRLDNMLFGEANADRPLTVVDWQTVTWGPAMTDLAYFLGCALPDDVRRDNYDALLRAYHDALGPNAIVGLEDVRDGVRRQSFFGVMMAFVASMLVERTERGDEMFMVMLARHAQHVLDTDALATLPEPAAPEALRPSAQDEGPHTATGESLWNESWYFDFADAQLGVGGWIRLGLYPNQHTAWINALLCGPDMPTVALNDFEVALPDGPRRRPHRFHRSHPRRDRAVADLQGVGAGKWSGIRRSGRVVARRSRQTRRADDGSGVGNGGHAVSIPHHPAL